MKNKWSRKIKSGRNKMNCEHNLNYDDQQSEPLKGNEYYYCTLCKESFVYDFENEKLIKQEMGI